MGGRKWYQDGLCFSCTQCGDCCSGDPGYVWISKEEIRGVAKFLGRSDGWLGDEMLRRVGFRYSLTEKPNGDCIFLERKNGMVGCTIYDVRPLQCRTWPFWSGNLRTIHTWNEAVTRCAGMNRGKRYTFEQIEEIRTKKSW